MSFPVICAHNTDSVVILFIFFLFFLNLNKQCLCLQDIRSAVTKPNDPIGNSRCGVSNEHNTFYYIDDIKLCSNVCI